MFLENTANGDPLVKIGNGLNWRLIRRDEGVSISQVENVDAEYPLEKAFLDPDITWRFPYPDEDDEQHQSLYDDKFNWEALGSRTERKDTFLANPAWLRDWDYHSKIVVPVSAESLGHAVKNNATVVNFIMNCPLSKSFDMNNSQESKGEEMPSYFALSGEKYVDGHPKTVFECGWCGTVFTEEDKIFDIKEYLLRYADRIRDNKWIEIANRIQ